MLNHLTFDQDAVKIYKPGSRKMRDYEKLMKAGLKLYEWQKDEKVYRKAKNQTETEETVARPVMEIDSLTGFRGKMGKEFRSIISILRSNGSTTCI